MVKSTTVEEEANMVYKDVEYKGISFQVLTNKRNVTALGHLHTYEPKAENKHWRAQKVIGREQGKDDKGDEARVAQAARRPGSRGAPCAEASLLGVGSML